jgi:hypothetical protein
MKNLILLEDKWPKLIYFGIFWAFVHGISFIYEIIKKNGEEYFMLIETI